MRAYPSVPVALRHRRRGMGHIIKIAVNFFAALIIGECIVATFSF